MRSTMRSTAPTSHRRSRTLTFAAGALITAATLAGCSPDKGPGSVVVTYVLGNNKSCAEIGVSDVRATAFKGSIDEPSVLYTDSVPCDDGELTLNSIEPNTYEVRVTGYDENGVAIFDNLGQISSERVVEVFEAAESSFDAELTARPAELGIRWRLGDGGFDNCAGVGIDRFQVTAYQSGGGTVLLETQLDCEVVGDAQGYRIVDDPDRALNGVLFGEVGIQAIAADGSEVGTPAPFVFDPVGPGYAVQLTIECTDAGCLAVN